jgi:hypothetical protein
MHYLNSLKSRPKMWAIYVCNFQSNCPKLSMTYRAKNRPIWSPWLPAAILFIFFVVHSVRKSDILLHTYMWETYAATIVAATPEPVSKVCFCVFLRYPFVAILACFLCMFIRTINQSTFCLFYRAKPLHQ